MINNVENSSDNWVKKSVFAAGIYTLNKPEFLETVNKVTDEFIAKRQNEVDLNELYPAYMTENINHDPRMKLFSSYVAQTGWNILTEQGHFTSNLETYFSSMWCQEHHKYSMMEQHVHGNGAQIVGFYFLNVPEGSSRVIFHHPNPGKVQINLPEQDSNNLTDASIMMNIEPTPGLLVFSNAWVPHSFTRNASEEPMRFIHFTINVAYAQNQCAPNVEVI
jgi:hypothetical protein